MERKLPLVSRKFWEIMHWAETLHSENKTRFWDPISVEKQVAAILYYLADEGRMRKIANSLVLGNGQFRKLSGVFCFYFRKFFPGVYLTKHHNYFTNRKSAELVYLLKANGNA